MTIWLYKLHVDCGYLQAHLGCSSRHRWSEDIEIAINESRKDG